nr:RNA-directed DNA polymerase, eukaryota, reverse transcriptase zinc-binding domain protein [Tanacetum cinerariifolium]
MMVVRSIHGADGGVGNGEGARLVSSGVKVGDGACTSFWDDTWVDDHKLQDRFPRLYYLERCKEAKIIDRGRWNNGKWKWVWKWTRDPRGNGGRELEELESTLHNIIIDSSCRDTWKWSLADNGFFRQSSFSFG